MHAHDVDEFGSERNPSRKRRPHEADPWYKRYPRDYFDDTRELTPEQRGLYNDAIELMYMAEGPIKDDNRLLAFKMCVDMRTWKRVRAHLLSVGMLYITSGKLFNKRVKTILAQRELERSSMGARGLAKPLVQCDLFENHNEINGPARASSPDIEIDKKKEDKSILSFEPRVIDGGKSLPARIHRYVSEDALNQVKTLAPGWDRQFLLKQFMDWPPSTSSETDIDTLFIRWIPKFTKGKKAS